MQSTPIKPHILNNERANCEHVEPAAFKLILKHETRASPPARTFRFIVKKLSIMSSDIVDEGESQKIERLNQNWFLHELFKAGSLADQQWASCERKRYVAKKRVSDVRNTKLSRSTYESFLAKDGWKSWVSEGVLTCRICCWHLHAWLNKTIKYT